MSVLKADHITIKFGGLTAVSNFCLTIKEGELLGLIGPNGAGKTTTFNILTGVYKPTSGKNYFYGQDTTIMRVDQIAALGVGRTFQNIRLFSELSVIDNVMLGSHVHLETSVFQVFFHTPQYMRKEEQIREEAMQLLSELHLDKFKNKIAGSLPYGEQRRLEIARALATKPKLLLLDEPAAGMNPQESKDLMNFIRKIQDDFNLTILLIEHDMKVVMGICRRILVMDYGVTIAEGNPREIQNNPEVIKAYLGVDASYA